MANLMNKNNRGWWPSVGDIKNYAYIQGLQYFTKGKRAFDVYQSALSAYYEASSGFGIEGKTFWRGVALLGSIAAQAKAAEENFLKKYSSLVGDLKDTEDWSQILNAFNTLLNSKATYIANLEKIKYIYNSEFKNSIWNSVDISKDFAKYIVPAVRKVLPQAINLRTGKIDEKIVKQTIFDGLKVMYGNGKGKKQKYKELFDIIDQIKNTNSPLLDQIYRLITPDIQRVVDSYMDPKQSNKMFNITNQSSKSGNFLEIIENFYISNITLQNFKSNGIEAEIYHTGGSNQKADNIIFLGQIKITEEQKEELIKKGDTKSSKVLQDIEKFEKLLPDLEKGIEDIIFISDKNYLLGSVEKYGGFAAQSNSSLKNVSAIWEKAGVDRISDLIFAITNIGSDMIGQNENQEEIETYLATKIANYMFDDISISDNIASKVTANRVHLFNLNGVYVPLSFYLTGLMQAFESLESSEIRQFANVQISAPNSGFKDYKDGYEQSEWEAFRNKRLNDVKISFHFFQNFAQYINDKINII